MPLLAGAVKSPVMVEVKSGETYNGTLQQADYYMNLHLADVTCTSADGLKFQHMADCYVRGNTVKFLRVTKGTLDEVTKSLAENKKPTFRGRGRSRPFRSRARGSTAPRGRSTD